MISQGSKPKSSLALKILGDPPGPRPEEMERKT
jgi:hypothetical protein